MNSSLKIPLAVMGGYVLGRRKKARMALLLCAWLTGRGLNIHPLQLGREALAMAANNPAVGKLGGDVKQQLLTAGKNAALATANSQMTRFADRLHDRTEALTGHEETAEPSDEEKPEPDTGPPRREERASGAPEGERRVPRQRSRQAGPKSEGPRKPAGRKAAKPAARKGTSRTRATRGGGDS